ncbi:MAG TPA: hypothetical protein PKJ19_13570 [Flavobacteriales bacterium]|nr:hypothetical protein [Flavobacteriales bacterium]
MSKDNAQYYSDEVSSLNIRLQDVEHERDELRVIVESIVKNKQTINADGHFAGVVERLVAMAEDTLAKYKK